MFRPSALLPWLTETAGAHRFQGAGCPGKKSQVDVALLGNDTHVFHFKSSCSTLKNIGVWSSNHSNLAEMHEGLGKSEEPRPRRQL